MPPEKEVVKDEDSLPSEDSEEGAAQRKGSGKERPAENWKRENERKSQEIAELREELEALKEAKEDRRDELLEKDKLSKKEEAELEDLEAQIAAIGSDKRSKAWIELNKREAAKLLKAERDKLDFEYALDQLEDLAEKEDTTPAKLEKKLEKFLRRYRGERPTRKLKLAYKDYVADKALQAKLDKLNETEEIHREKSEKTPTLDRKEAMKLARESKDFRSILATVDAVQHEARSKS